MARVTEQATPTGPLHDFRVPISKDTTTDPASARIDQLFQDLPAAQRQQIRQQLGEYLRSLTDTPDDISDDALWVRNGLLVREHLKHLAGSARAVTSYDLSTPFVSVDGTSIANVNHPANWYGLFLEDEHATDGVRRPSVAGSTNRFGLNARTGLFEKSDGTDWLEYDPFANDEPWDNAYPYGAWVDCTFNAGAKEDNGFRITMIGKIDTQIGENGNDWEVRTTVDQTITEASNVVVSADLSIKRILIEFKAIDGGSDAPSIVAIVAAINNFTPGGTLIGLSLRAGYVGPIFVADKVDANFSAGSRSFANGSAGTEGVDLVRLNHWAESFADLGEAWSAVGQVGLDFGGADLHGVTAYTAAATEHTEKTEEIYKPPGFNQVVDITEGGRPSPGPASRGKLFVDHERGLVNYDVRQQIAAANASATSTAYTHADYFGALLHQPSAADVNRLYYNLTGHYWEISTYLSVLGTHGWSAVANFDDLGTVAGLQAEKHWLGERANRDAAVDAVTDYVATTRYYFYNRANSQVEYLSAYVAPIYQHEQWTTRALVSRSPYTNNPTLVLWGMGQTQRVNTEIPETMYRSAKIGWLKWQLDDSELFFGAENGWVDILTAAEAGLLTGVDSIPPAANRGEIYFQLRAGVWSFDGGVAVQPVQSGDYVEAHLTRVNATAVDHVISRSSVVPFAPTASNLGEPDLQAQILYFAPLIRVAADDVFYVSLSDLQGTGTDTTDDASAQLHAVYHGPV